MTNEIQIQHFFDDDTHTLTYIVWDERTRDAVVIDPVLDYEPRSSRTTDASVAELSQFVRNRQLHIHWVLETHAHADHLSGAQLMKQRFDAPVAIGEGISTVQETFKELLNLPPTFATDGSQFDKLIVDGERFSAGALTIEAMATPGHTPACMSFIIGDAVFTGDALFMHDYGTGRADFPKGCASALYHSIHNRLYALPDATRVFVGHDYQPGGREMRYEATIGQSKRLNPHLRAETQQEAFVKFRTERDAQLSAPRLLFQSIQVNLDAGCLPDPHPNGQRYFTIPVNLTSEPANGAVQSSQ